MVVQLEQFEPLARQREAARASCLRKLFMLRREKWKKERGITSWVKWSVEAEEQFQHPEGLPGCWRPAQELGTFLLLLCCVPLSLQHPPSYQGNKSLEHLLVIQLGSSSSNNSFDLLCKPILPPSFQQNLRETLVLLLTKVPWNLSGFQFSWLPWAQKKSAPQSSTNGTRTFQSNVWLTPFPLQCVSAAQFPWKWLGFCLYWTSRHARQQF